MKKTKPTHWLIAVILLLPFLLSFHARAAGASVLPPGTYPLSASLSCYVNAMGGVEFGASLLTDARLTVTEDGSETITLHFTKSSVTIYSVTCDTFIDASPSYVTEDRGVKSGVIGYYDKDGVLRTEDVAYTLSEDTALNAAGESVHYVDSVTFPVDSRRETYALTLYINSNVMGVQFTQPNAAATAATHPATLTVDWSSVGSGAAPTSAEKSTEATTPAANGKEEMDGLNLYRAGEGTAAENAVPTDNAGDAALSRRAYLNPTVLIVMGNRRTLRTGCSISSHTVKSITPIPSRSRCAASVFRTPIFAE